MAASGAKYGIATSHFYWLGAIPAMVFVGMFMMPFYYGSRARSVPEYLRLRFDEKTRGLNAITFALMTIMSSGISMYAMAKLDPDPAHLRRALRPDGPLDRPGSLTRASRFGTDRAGVRLPGRAHQRHLQRGAPVLPDRRRLPAPGASGPVERRRLGRDSRPRCTIADSFTHAWVGMAPGRRIPTRSASRSSGWRWAWGSCSRSATGAPTSWSCSGPWRPTPCRRRGARP